MEMWTVVARNDKDVIFLFVQYLANSSAVSKLKSEHFICQN